MTKTKSETKHKHKDTKKTTTRKEHIPKAVREQVWLKRMGETYSGKCTVSWCENQITVFDFHVGHNEPESKGGTLSISNLDPICARCNLSMSDSYTITEWEKTFATKPHCCSCLPFF